MSSSRGDLAPGFLLASPRLGDPNFQRSIVLLGKHGEAGALGWVLNGKTVAGVGELLSASGLVPAGLDLPASNGFSSQARIGGPVAGASAWIVFRRRDGIEISGQIEVGPDIAVTGDATALQQMIRGGEPREFRVVVGCAGWAPGQLETELQEGAWLPAAIDPVLVFEKDPDSIWELAYQKTIGTTAVAFTSTQRGSA